MLKKRPIRNRKSEMASCWACTVFLLIILLGKFFLLGFDSISVIDYAILVLIGMWFVISLIYTILYFRYREPKE